MAERGKGTGRNASSSSSSATEPFAEDVRVLRERLEAERRAAACAPLLSPRRISSVVQKIWLQYLITWAAYCFDWWERLIVHACLLSVVGLCCYGVRLGWKAASAAVGVAAAAAEAATAARAGRGVGDWWRRSSSPSSSPWSSLSSWALN